MVLVGVTIAGGIMGDPNASIPTPQPTHFRPMFGSFGRATSSSAMTFVSGAAHGSGIKEKLGISKDTAPVENTRGNISKSSMKLNNLLPTMEVDPETYEVRADGRLLTCEPAESLPMAQRYFLF